MKFIEELERKQNGKCVFCNRNFDKFGGALLLLEYRTINGYSGMSGTIQEPFEVCNKDWERLKNEDNNAKL